MSVAKLIIDKNIGSNDEYAEIFGMPDPNFSADDMRAFLQENEQATELEITISSNGGSTDHGFEIYDMLKTCGKSITTIAFKCNSIATIIFLAGTTRKISKNCTFVPHNPYIDPSNLGFVGLTADDLQVISNEIRKIEDKMYNTYCEVLGLSGDRAAELKSIMAQDVDITSQGAIDWGFATELIGENIQAKTIHIGQYSHAIAALLKTKQKNNSNNMDIKDMKNSIDNIKGMISAFFKANGLKEDGTKDLEVKAASASLGEDKKVYFEGSLQKDAKCFTDEAMNEPMAAGDYTTAGGDTFSVNAEGVVTAYTPKAEENPEDLEAVKAEVVALKKENADLKKAIEDKEKAFKAKADDAIAKVVAISKELDQLKEVVPGENKKNSAGADVPIHKKFLDKRREIGVPNN